MKKHIHIHIHTADANFEESQHPRAANGQFGYGGGGGGEKKDPAPGSKQDSLNKLNKLERLINSTSKRKPTTLAHQPAHEADIRQMKKQYEKQRAQHEATYGKIQPSDWK